jgi:hypothetical protein
MELKDLNERLKAQDGARGKYKGLELTTGGPYLNPCPMYRDGFSSMVRHLTDHTTVVTAVSKRGPLRAFTIRVHDDDVRWESVLEGFAFKNDMRTAFLDENAGLQLIVGRTERRRGPIVKLLYQAAMEELDTVEAESELREFMHAALRKQKKEREPSGLLGALAAAAAMRSQD